MCKVRLGLVRFSKLPARLKCDEDFLGEKTACQVEGKIRLRRKQKQIKNLCGKNYLTFLVNEQSIFSWTDKQIDRETERPLERQRDLSRDRETFRETERPLERQRERD